MHQTGPRLSVMLALSLLALASAGTMSGAPSLKPMQTEAQAEVHLLRIVTRSWNASRMPGLVNPRTRLLADNTQAVCRGLGEGRSKGLYTRFVCIVRPLHHRPGQGLYVSYRVIADGRCECHWLAYRRR